MTRTSLCDLAMARRLAVLALVMLTTILALAGCETLGPRVHVDYANIVRYRGIVYFAQSQQFGRPLAEDDLGPVQFKVTFCLQESQDTPTPTGQDGIAGQLSVGTPLYAVVGYAPAFRLAAVSTYGIILYEAQTNAAAHSGADLLDISGKVADIRIISGSDGKTVLATIDTTADARSLVAMVLAAPIRQPGAEQGPTAYHLVFDLRDGTAVERDYYQDGQLGVGIMTPPAFGHALGHALDAAVSAQAGTAQPTSTGG